MVEVSEAGGLGSHLLTDLSLQPRSGAGALHAGLHGHAEVLLAFLEVRRTRNSSVFCSLVSYYGNSWPSFRRPQAAMPSVGWMLPR